MQVCLLDLDYNLPVQVRDTALGISNEDTPQSDVGKEYQLNEAIKAGTTDSSFSEQRPNDLLQRLQRTTPYYKVGCADCVLGAWLLCFGRGLALLGGVWGTYSTASTGQVP